MGTRSMTYIKEDGATLLAIYRQYDGYPEGHGRDLAKVFEGRRMTNGIPGGSDSTQFFNGTGCMAAQIVRQLKDDEAGGIYIESPDADDDGCDYTYIIETGRVGEGFNMTFTEPRLTVLCWGKQIFQGDVAEFTEFCKNPEYAEE